MQLLHGSSNAETSKTPIVISEPDVKEDFDNATAVMPFDPIRKLY